MSLEDRYNTVSIPRSTYNQMQTAAANAANAAKTAKQLQTAIRQMKDDFKRQQQKMREKQQEEIDKLNDVIRHNADAASKQARDLNEALADEIRNRNNAIAAVETKARENLNRAMETVNRSIENVRDDLNDRIQSMRADVQMQIGSMQSEIATIDAQLNNMQSTDQENRERAEVLYRNAVALDARIKSIPLQHSGLTVMEINNLDQLNGNADFDINNKLGTGYVAFLSSRAYFQAALEMQLRAESAENEWQLLYQVVQQELGKATATLSALEEVPMDLVEDAAPVTIDVDYWAGGAIKDLQQTVANIKDRLEKEKDSLTKEDLDDILSALQEIDSSADEAVAFAGIACRESQRRADMNNEIKRQLFKNGFTMLNHGFEGRDCRASHRIHLADKNTGCEFFVTFTPTVQADNSIANDISLNIIHCGTQTHNPELLAKRRTALRSALRTSLQRFGIQLSDKPSVERIGEQIDRTVQTDEVFATATSCQIAKPVSAAAAQNV